MRGRGHRAAIAWLVSMGAFFGTAHAQDGPPADPAGAEPANPDAALPDDLLDDDSLFELEALTVTHQVRNEAGAMQRVGQETLEKLEYDDPHSVLLTVPGVYVRTEDGYGLRPNIGMRGAAADRSKKITLLEDGVLLAPAPYSAPAAYYFPLMTRMVGVEVWKGPSAVRFGPHTVGGAVNMISRDIPETLSGAIDLAGGMNWYGKAHGWVGASHGAWGILLEGVHLRTDGFKDLDGGGDTGFDRSDARLKLRLQGNPEDKLFQKLELILGYGREGSNETYLGLTDADFREQPYRRYRASALDGMDWWRTEARLQHRLAIEDVAEIVTVGYRQDFSRLWRRLNGFRDGTGLSDILNDPTGRRAIFYDVLRGAADSSTPGEALIVASNERAFVSEGVQSTARGKFETGGVHHRPELGLRLHHDRIERDHTEDSYSMIAGNLERDTVPTVQATDNTASALAFSAHLYYEVEFWRLTLSPGARLEVVSTELEDGLAATTTTRTDTALLPGAGARFALTDEVDLLAGVYQGFSPVAPGQPESTKAEKSVNYEGGLRYTRGAFRAEAIGFFNDYSNLTGQCTFSSGCDDNLVDRQFNAGSVHIYGAEVTAEHRVELPSVAMPLRLSYTLTQSSFRTAFLSENPEFGNVEKGDELPYVPMHQASLTVGLERTMWNANLVTTYVGRMRETASDEGPLGDAETDAYLLMDFMAAHDVFEAGSLYLRVDNLLGVRPIAARRPFGARPTKPLLAQVGFKYEF